MCSDFRTIQLLGRSRQCFVKPYSLRVDIRILRDLRKVVITSKSNLEVTRQLIQFCYQNDKVHVEIVAIDTPHFCHFALVIPKVHLLCTVCELARGSVLLEVV
jgi:hypothetical protein